MQRYGRYCLAIMIMALSAWLVLPIFFAKTQAWLKHLQVADEHTLSSTASSSLVYPIKPNQWLKFALLENSPQLRIITNAHIKRPEIITPGLTWAYAIHYEFLNTKGEIIKKGVYHQRSHLTTYKDAQGKPIYGNFYLDKNLVPLDGRLILLDIQAMKDAAFVRVSLEAINPDIVEAAVRLYVPSKIAEHRVAVSWLRMTQIQKNELAKNSVYPESLLSAEEQINLLKHQWQPLGPMGIDGEDYQTLNLYTLTDKELESETLIEAAGLQADLHHEAVIPLPEYGGKVDLNFSALDGSALTTPVVVNLQWFGRETEQRWQQNARWSEKTGDLSYSFDGGLLVIRPSSPVIVHAYLTTDTEPKHDISDAQLPIKTYLSNFGIDFSILHDQQQAATLRVDVRRLLSVIPSQQERVRYQGLNAQQQVIISGELTALEPPSLFDRVGSLTEPNNVSDPVSYYFSLPVSVTRLRLISNTPELLVSVYNRPYDAVKWQRIPEDAYVDKDKQNLQPTWFTLRAENDKSLTQQQAVLWLSGQHHPPEDKPDVLAGAYLWQDYLPQKGIARYLLTDYTDQEARDDALTSVYCALSVNRDSQVKLSASHGLRSVTPDLIFLRDNFNPFTAELFYNQQKVFVITTMGQQGIMHLPEIALGEQHIRLNTDSGGRWLMNYQERCTGEQLLKRRVFALNSNAALDFVVQHTNVDEVLSARLYSPTNSVDRSQIKVDIAAITATTPRATVSTNWTYQQRLYDIRPLPTKAMPILYTQGQSLSNGERFAIPINSDLPAGAYHIRITLAKGSAAYITLSQVKAGVYEQRRFYQENKLATQ